MERHLAFFLFFSVLLRMTSLSFGVDVDQSTFIARLNQLANDQLGISRFQQFIDDQRNSKASFSQSVPNGQTMAAQIAKDVEQSVQKYADAVRRIQTAYSYGQPRDQIQTDLCCGRPNLFYDPRFSLRVDTSSVCHLTRFEMSVNNDVKNAMIDNLKQLPNIKWQYYGTEQGLHVSYPARDRCNESYTFDPRKRPWYTGTVNIPRDVVVLLDRSTPMNQIYSSGSVQQTPKLVVAKNAASAILKYLNQNDRVSVLAFSNLIVYAGDDDSSCFHRELAVANANNINQLSTFVNDRISLDTSGVRPSFELALKTAAQIFNASDNKAQDTLFTDREKIILLLTAGNPVEKCSVLSELEAQLFASTVNVFVMEVSEGPTSETNCLRNLTKGPYGAYGLVPDSDFNDLRGQLGFFYNAFIDKIDETNVTFSIPFADVNGLRLETSACLPLFGVDRSLMGVTCVEMSFADILSEIVEFRLNKLSYAFVVDKRGRVLLHPLLPSVTYWQNQLPLLELKDVEISSYAFDVEKKITSGLPGNQTVIIKRFTPVGQSNLQGVRKFETTATYYWNSIPSMRFFLCLVIVQNEVASDLTWTGGLSNVFLSDEMDPSQNVAKCGFYNKVFLNSSETSVVKLAPKAFKSAEDYLEVNLNASDILQLKQYITWKGIQSQTFALKEGIRDVVAMTSVLGSYWSPAAADVRQNVLALYIGTADGVYRRYPTVRIPKTFDPTTQPWYVTALYQPQQLTLTLPFVDYASRLPMISLSQTVFSRSAGQQQQQHLQSDPIFGVMGMDLTVKYLYNMLTSTIPQCSLNGQECFLIDSSGLVVVHKDFERSISNVSLHVTAREPAIASELTQKSVMMADACVNYEEVPLRKQLFYRIALTAAIGSCQTLSTCIICTLGYSSSTVTNLFLVVKLPNSRSTGNNCDCPNRTDGSQPCSYNLTSGNRCQCPCTLSVDYDSCLSNINIDPSIWQPCIPSEETETNFNELPLVGDVLAEDLGLRPCWSCNGFNDEDLCEANNCFWLSNNSTCGSEPNPTTSATVSPNASPTAQSTGSNSVTLGLAIGLTIGLVLLAACVVAILVWCHRRRRQPSQIITVNDKYEKGAIHITTITVKDDQRDPPSYNNTRGSDAPPPPFADRSSAA